MDSNINLTILNEINKGAKMGMDSISFVSPKVGEPVMKDNLSYQYTQYQNIVDKVADEFSKYSQIPDEENMATKAMGWMGINFNTITDKSNSHIAEMLIQGTTMGIIEGRKLLNHNPKADKEVKNLLHEFVCFQENNIEKMKEFL